MIEFTVEGRPVGKARPRVTRNGTYTPKKTKGYEELVKWSCRSKYKGGPLKGPLRIEIVFYMYIPKNTSQVRIEKKLVDERLPTKMPDWDNMAKSITDAINGIAYEDDSQIVEAHIYKKFSKDPRAEVKITQIDAEGV